MTTDKHDKTELDEIQQAYINRVVRVVVPVDPVAAGLFWFRQGITWQQQCNANDLLKPSSLELDPPQLLMMAFERARNLWQSTVRLEHLLMIAIDDPQHSMSKILKSQNNYAKFRSELMAFIDSMDKDNAEGLHAANATPEALRVFEDLAMGTRLVDAICKEHPQGWARLLVEKYFAANNTTVGES
jgi:hypothetical protein